MFLFMITVLLRHPALTCCLHKLKACMVNLPIKYAFVCPVHVCCHPFGWLALKDVSREDGYMYKFGAMATTSDGMMARVCVFLMLMAPTHRSLKNSCHFRKRL